MSADRPTDWQSITTTRESWERFCWIVGMQTIVRASTRVVEEGATIAEAINASIEETAREIERDGAPPGLADAFRKQYLRDRANQMRLVADHVEMRRRIEAKHAEPKKRSRAATMRKKRSDAGTKRGPRPTAEEQQRRMKELDEQDRRELASWPDQRLRELVVAVEGGRRNDVEGWEARPLADVFELRLISEELARRGWPPLRI